MTRKALANKIFCIGVDGMDPRLTRKYVDEGKMPNVKKLIERGACRHDLAMVGAMPTVTPPMWTTLAQVHIQTPTESLVFIEQQMSQMSLLTILILVTVKQSHCGMSLQNRARRP